MAMKLNPPVFNSKEKTFERWKVEIEMWSEVTDLAKNKMGIAVALSLPENDSTVIREQVMEEVKLDDLKKDDGLKTLLTFMEKKLGKDDMEDSLEKYEEFKNCRREQDQKIGEFIHEFEQKYNRILKKGIKLPEEILCFELLSSANISKPEKMLILSGINFEKKENLFDQAKKSLKKFKGDLASSDDIVGATAALKLEPTFFTSQEEALVADNLQYQRGRSWPRGRGFRGASYYRGRKTDRGGSARGNEYVKPVNPKGPDGNPLSCHGCGSYRHLVGACPHSYENARKTQQAHISESAEKVVLFTGYNKNEIERLGEEAINCAVLDTACTSTVCGTRWMQCFLDGFSEGERKTVTKSEGHKIFKFGGGEQLKSQMSCQLPCTIAGKDVIIEVDVVDSSIPMLLSLKSLKKAKAKLNLERDTAELFGTEVPLNFTTSGHYCIPVDRKVGVKVDEVCNTVLSELQQPERKKAILKLHRQFAHPSMPRLKALMVDAGVWKDEYQEELNEIYSSCNTCKLYGKTPARPVVGMPMASRFNEKVAMDLKSWKGKYILHMIDMFTRLSVSVFINRKTSEEVVENVLQHWIGAGWGVMEGIFFDNGGEFNNDEVREVASLLNVKISSTPAESPWSNGLCERNHQITDRMLEILVEENPHTNEKLLLAWANVAKNSLQMWNGFSSYQLVLGKNPNLPNIMTEKLPALQGVTSSEILKTHLDALYAARRAFMKCEADEKIRRALRHQIRASEEVFLPGDGVFYKRDGSNKWLGPGKVIFQDGKVVFVRHGGTYVRVSTNRLVKETPNSGAAAPNPEKGTGNHVPTSCPPSDEITADHITVEHHRVSEVLGDPAMPNHEPHHTVEHVGQPRPLQQPEDRPPDPHEPPQEQMAAEPQQQIILKRDDRIEYKAQENDQWTQASILGRAGKANTSTRYWYNVEDNTTGVRKSVNLQELNDWRKIEEDANMVLIPRNKHDEAECLKAKETELQKLVHFDVYTEVDDEGQPCISTTWVLTDKEGQIKARLVARGFEESETVERDSPTVAKSTMRLLITTAMSRGWSIKSSDIKSAFLQGKEIQREVFIKPPVEAKRGPGKVWKLKKTLYGLVDAARQFYESVRDELVSLGMRQSKVDSSLFYKVENGEVIGALITHIDDFMHCGNESFDETVMKPLITRFVAGKQESSNFRYIGFEMKQTSKEATLDQGKYVNGIEGIRIDPGRAKEKNSSLTTVEQKQLRRLVGQCNWVAQGTRPDLAYEVVELSSKFKDGHVSDLIRANKNLLKLKQHRSFIMFPNLGPCRDWKIVVFSDAAHANMSDGVSSVGGHLILLVGRNKRSVAIAWSCSKIKRVVKSTLAAEMLSLSEALDHAIYLKQIIMELTGADNESIPVEALVDNKSVEDAIYSTKSVDDKRLRIDVGSIKEMLNKKEVAKVQWIPGEKMLANALTKRGASSFDLLRSIQEGRLAIIV